MFNLKNLSSVSSVNFSRAFLCAAAMLALFTIAASAIWLVKVNAQNASSGQTQPTQEVPTLELGKPIERELAGGQSHSYKITLAEGQYLNLVVEQRGVDVAVALVGPDGAQLANEDGETRKKGSEKVEWVVAVAGSYQLSVRVVQKNSPIGKYEIRVATLRSSTEQERVLHEARQLMAEFTKLYRAAKYDEARTLVEQSLELREKILGPEHPNVAHSLHNLANLYATKGDYERAEPLYQRALTIFEKAFGAEHPSVALSLNNLAVLYTRKGKYVKAEPAFQRTLTIREKALGTEHLDVALTLNSLANLYNTQGNYIKAEPLYQRALTIAEKAMGADNIDVARALNNLAILYDTKGDYVKAEPLYQRALTVFEKLLGAEHPYVASTLDNLASLNTTKGEYAKAESLLQRSLMVREKALGTGHTDVARSLHSLANLYEIKGDYVNSELLYQRALTVFEKALGPEHPDVAHFLSNLASLYSTKGDYVKAEPLLQRALSVREKALGPEHPSVAFSLNSLANLYTAQADYVKTESLLQRALKIREKALGPEHRDVADTLHSLANLYYMKGDYVRAEPLYQRAVTIFEKSLGPVNSNVARALNNLASLCTTKGDYVKAEQLLQRSLMIRRNELGAEHPEVASSLNNLAVLYEAKGDPTQAVIFRTRANAVTEHNIALNLSTGSERQKLAYLIMFTGELHQTISLHVRSAPANMTACELALTTTLQRKGRALDAMADSLAVLRRRAKPQDQTLFDRVQEVNSQLARLVLNGSQRVTPNEHQRQIKVLEEQKEIFEVEISSRSTEFRTQSQPVTLAAVQAAIPDKAALIEFFAYRPFNAKHQKESESFGPARYVAYALHQRGEVQWVELGETKAIDAAVENLRQALRDPKRMDAKRLARKVDRMVMQPLRPLLGTTRRVLLSPDSVLNLVPFAALVDEHSQYLIQRYTFTYLTSGRDLLRMQIKQESKSVPFVLADPAFDGQPTVGSLAQRDIKPVYGGSQSGVLSIDFANAKFKSLPGTAGEAQALKQMLPDAVVLTREQATKAALKQVSRPYLLHIATHGFFLPDLKLNSGETTTSMRVENPLLRSGLALAGANVHKGQSDDDGILTALEAAGLDLWGTKLVVLSACNTGVGEVKNGDGVYGLRRAFVLAGSETQVMSLWSVSDQGTKELMVEYYKRLLRGEGRGEALRQVQLQMLKNPKRSHPFYWASFIQSGEWANLDGKR